MARAVLSLTSLSVVLLLAVGSPPAQAGKKRARENQELMAQAPVLSAMVADVYATGVSPPSDAVVALVSGSLGLELDEALSGAAAALAMERLPPPGDGVIRWAALRAGFPFPVEGMAWGRSTSIDAPVDVVAFLEEGRDQGLILGLARVRMEPDDVWVALAAPRLPLGPFARQHSLGDFLAVALPASASWTLVDPQGGVIQGRGSLKAELDLAGEWLLDLEISGQALALPIFVDLAMPATRVLHEQVIGVGSREEAILLAETLLGDLRVAASMEPLGPDPTLGALLSRPVADAADRGVDRTALYARLKRSGFVNGVELASCGGATVSECLETLYDSPEFRVALLDPGYEYLAVEAQVRPDGVSLLIGLAAE